MSLFRFVNLRPRYTKSSQRQRRKPTLTRFRPLLEELESRYLLTSALVAAYNFDQGSGSVLTDVSGNGNNGTIVNATWNTTGKYGGALSFNGTNALVNIPNAASLQLTTGMTLEAWVDPTAAANGWQDVLYKGTDNYFLESSSSPSNGPVAGATVGSNDTGAFGTTPLPTNSWSFLTETYDGSTLRLYVNSVQVASQALSGSLVTSTNQLQIGGDSIYGQYFQGLIDNVRIYNTALTQSAIQTDMNTPISTTDIPPTVTAVTPANNGSNVSTGTAVTVQFSEALDPTTVTTSTIQLLNSSGSAVADSVTYNSSTNTATLTPTSALANSSAYTVSVHGGTSGAVIKDAADNPMAANFSSTFTTAAASTTQSFPNNQAAPPLPAPTGTVINVSTASQLQSAVANLQSGQTIMIAAGTYNLTGTLYVPQGLTNIAIRGATGKAGDVVIQGDAVLDSSSPYTGSAIWGTGSGISGSIPFGVWLGNVQGVTIADLTLKNFVDDAIILNAGVQSPLIHNVVMLDTGEQLLKSNPDGSGGGVNNGIVEYCTVGYSSLAPNNYTNGIDLHTTQNWIIRNNLFQNIATTNPATTLGPGAMVGPAILVWNGSKNCTVVNNTFINCQREIAFGLTDPTGITDDNSGGIIANNFIYRSGTQHGDVPIGVWNSPGTEVAYNTIILNGDYVNAIEYRFSTTTGVNILYNLTDSAITQRDSATATLTGNVTSGVQSAWFVNESAGNLHLTSAATGAIGKGKYLAEVSTDYDGQARPSTGPTDVGADEYTVVTDTPPTVTSVTPANKATNVAVGTTVTVQFSEALDPTTVNSNTIQLLTSSNTAVAASVTFNASTETATLTPSAALANNGTYTVLVHGGTSGAVIKDAAETPLAANFSSSFTTVVTLPATPSGLTAAAGNAQVTLNWSASSGATSYNIYRSTTTSGGEGTTPYKTGVTSTSFTDTGLTNGTTYYYKVSAVNAGGQSPLSSEVSAAPRVTGLVAAYNFAQGTGTVLTDVSGNGNNGTLTNGAWVKSYSSALPFTNALYVNGKTNSMVTIPDSVSLDLTAGMTLEAWVSPKSLSSGQGWAAVIGKDYLNSSNPVSYALYAASGTGNPTSVHVLDNGSNNGVQGTSQLALNTWTFLSATYDGSTLKLYVNGNLVSSQSVSGTITATGKALHIGGDGAGQMFTGSIGNVRIYNTALSQSAIQTDMKTPILSVTDTAPTVTSVTPANNTTGVSTSPAITIQFSKALAPATVSSSTVQLLNASGKAVSASVTYNSSTYTVTLTPSAALAINSTYTVLVHGGTSGYIILDSAGTPLAANFSSSFTTDAPLTASAGPAESSKEGTAVQFAGSASGGTGGTAYSWSFGDGSTASGTLTPSHTYSTAGSYTVTLTVTDNANDTTKSTATATIADAPPTANPGGPYSSTTGKAISFSGSASDPDPKDTLTYSWNFGDGSTSTQLAPSHTYTTAGTYNVTFTVTASDGAKTSATTTAAITATSPLTASAGPAEAGKEGTAVKFTGSASGGTGGTTYSWNFGDGSTASGTLTPGHTYSTAGSYTVTLTVTDNANDTIKSTTTATIADVPPTANPGGPYSGVTSTAVNFNGSASDPDPKDTLTYSWNFGDGSTSTQLAPSHTYTTAGTFNVTFTVTASDGVQTSATTTVTVSNQSNLIVSSPTITTPYLSIPNFGAKPTISSIKSGNWSDSTVWSLGRTPQAGDIIDINPGTTVTYNVNDSTDAVPFNTLEIQPTATLTFATNINTQICVGNFLVLSGGSLIVGTAANPIAANVHANIDIANQALNSSTDPNQFGTGLIVLGNVTMHGATMVPYATLAQEAHAGDTVLHFANPVTGWQVGQDILLPDTRQLTTLISANAFNTNIAPQWENVVIQSISADGLTVTLTAPLKYDHLGARDAKGVLQYLPQIMNDNRNIMVESQSFTGTRGYTLFTARANVDIEYAGFCELGRTINAVHSSTNVADRYAMTMLDLIGPTTPQANGYQFTLIGNEVDNDGDGNPNNPSNIQWGIALTNSFYGLIQSNDVFSVAGAGIGVEDGASSYNVFDKNMVMLVTGTGGRLDDQLQGDGYWFHNPNNYVTNNIATDINGYNNAAYSYGFSIDAVTNESAAVGTVLIAAYQGADPSQSGQSKSINMNATPILKFSGNEAYGALPRGFSTWWLGTQFETPDGNAGTLQNSVVWNQYDAGYFTYETNNLIIDGFTALGDASQLSDGYNYTVGLYFGDYMTRNAVVENVNVQDECTGITAPQNVGRGGASDVVSFTIQNAYLQNTSNVYITVLASSNGGSGLSSRKVIIQNVQFVQPNAALPSGWQPENIETNSSYGADPSFENLTSTTEVDVINYNNVAGDNFYVYFDYNKPANATTMALIKGYVVAG